MRIVSKFCTPILILVLIVLQGCSGVPINVGASQETDISLYDLDNPRTESASASGFQLLLFIPISINDRQERAYEVLKRKAGNGLIGDVKVKESWTYGLIGTAYTTTIEAEIYPRK